MRLLISVRSVGEVRPALAGGGDIIDVKEPARGGLGPADPQLLEAVAEIVPVEVMLGVALGDPSSPTEAGAAARRLNPHRKAGEVVLKMGFADAGTDGRATELFEAAVAGASKSASMVAVAYADWSRAGAPTPASVVHMAARLGATGVLLDTFGKDDRDLFAWMPADEVMAWIRTAQSVGLLAAVAGSLGADAMARLRETPPDVIGFRGAACRGGRLGTVSETRVRALRAAMDAAHLSRVPAAKRMVVTPLTTL